MKKHQLLWSSLAVLLMNFSVAFADETSHRQAAIALLDSVNITETMIASVDKMVELEVRSNPQLLPYQDVMNKFFVKYMTGPEMIEEFATLYMEEFTEQELIDITDFYKTETGKKAISKLPVLMQKGAMWGQNKVQQNLPELQQMIQAETQRIKKLQEASPQ